MTILGATGAEYTPTTDDAGQYLRATASYTDNHGPGKTAAAVTADPVEPVISRAQNNLRQFRLTGTITSGDAKTNVARLARGFFVNSVTFQACIGASCTPSSTGRVAAGTKITSVGMTVGTNGQVDYDGTLFAGSVVKVSAHRPNGSVIRFATIKVAAPTSTPTVTKIEVVSTPGECILTDKTQDPPACYGDASDTYAALEQIWIEVTFSHAIVVEGRPVLALHVGVTATEPVEPVVRYADFMHVTGGNKALFEYLPLYGDKDTDGISIPKNPLLLLDGDRIYDVVNEVDVNPNHRGTTDAKSPIQIQHLEEHKVDGRLGIPEDMKALPTPTLSTISVDSSPASGGDSYAVGEEIRLTAHFLRSDAKPIVLALDNWPKLKLDVGGEIRLAEVASVTPISHTDRRDPVYGDRWIRFVYTVQEGDVDTDGISIPADPFVTSESNRVYNAWNRDPAVLTYAGLGNQGGHKVGP